HPRLLSFLMLTETARRAGTVNAVEYFRRAGPRERSAEDACGRHGAKRGARLKCDEGRAIRETRKSDYL
ncbi:hypothetical protein NDU88_001653, partial [Pleurodeles waltl]